MLAAGFADFDAPALALPPSNGDHCTRGRPTRNGCPGQRDRATKTAHGRSGRPGKSLGRKLGRGCAHRGGGGGRWLATLGAADVGPLAKEFEGGMIGNCGGGGGFAWLRQFRFQGLRLLASSSPNWSGRLSGAAFQQGIGRQVWASRVSAWRATSSSSRSRSGVVAASRSVCSWSRLFSSSNRSLLAGHRRRWYCPCTPPGRRRRQSSTAAARGCSATLGLPAHATWAHGRRHLCSRLSGPAVEMDGHCAKGMQPLRRMMDWQG